MISENNNKIVDLNAESESQNNYLMSEDLEFIGEENFGDYDEVLRNAKEIEKLEIEYFSNFEDKCKDVKMDLKKLNEKIMDEGIFIKNTNFIEREGKPQATNDLTEAEEINDIGKLNLSTRAYNVLIKNKLYYIEDIVKLTKENIYSIPNIGRKIAKEIIEELNGLGYQLKEKDIDYLESQQIIDNEVEYNMICIFRLLEAVFETRVEKKFEESQAKEFFGRVDNSLNTLKEKEKEILIERFGLRDGKPKTLEDIAYKFELTRERIRQIENRAIGKLKDIRRTRILRKYISIERSVVDENMTNYILNCVYENE